MILTLRVKESIKTALAMTIAYGIALSLDWDRPYWAGFAVAFISLSTVGQSLNKGALRMLGTLLALVVSLIIIAMFVQDRWWFMLALSGWVSFCTYRMMHSKRGYFWFLAGFASVIISFDGGTDPINAFNTAILRAQETGLGVLVYTLVTTLLWPNSSRAGFEAATKALVDVQHRLYSGYRQAMMGSGSVSTPAKSPTEPKSDGAADMATDPELRAIASQHDQCLAQFGAMLESALTDSYAVWELRRQWHRFQQQSAALREILARWQASSAQIAELDLDALLPTLSEDTAEIGQRLTEIERLLGGEQPQHSPQALVLRYDRERAAELSHFHKAAFGLMRSGLQRLDQLTRAQLDTVLDIQGFAAAASDPAESHTARPESAPSAGLLPDPDGMIAMVRVAVGLWLAYLLWIYVEVPGGAGIVSATASLGMTLATMPRVSPLLILWPSLASIAVSGLLYVFLMPQLSRFTGLGTMIFLFVFSVAYLFSTPAQGVIRAIALSMFLMVIGVSNQQHYSILGVIDTAVMLTMMIGILTLVSRFPFTMQADKAFLRLLTRFFRSSEYLMTSMRWDPGRPPSRLDRWRRAYHARQVMTLPRQLANWGKTVNPKVLPGTTTAQIEALTDSLQVLSYRVQELMDTRDHPQAPLLVRELLMDLRAWRLKVQEILLLFSSDPAATPKDQLSKRLSANLDRLEGRIEQTLNQASEGELSTADGENFYRLLGAYRGVSEAVVAYAGAAQGIAWERWRDSRF